MPPYQPINMLSIPFGNEVYGGFASTILKYLYCGLNDWQQYAYTHPTPYYTGFRNSKHKDFNFFLDLSNVGKNI